MNPYILKFSEIGIDDISKVGGKNASLGEMYNHLMAEGMRVSDGFAVTTKAYKDFIGNNNLGAEILALGKLLDKKDFSNLKEVGLKARRLILDAKFPLELENAISSA